jgi:hypothetical protein
MKIILFVLALLVVMTGLGSRAEAVDYPWCAEYSRGGGTNCGFVTFEQCMATISGIGGFCSRNTQYRPNTPAASAPRKARRHSDNDS